MKEKHRKQNKKSRYLPDLVETSNMSSRREHKTEDIRRKKILADMIKVYTTLDDFKES